MMDGKSHITVCLCTYRRPALLEKLLEGVARQETDGLFSFSISIVDNDPEQSARPVVEDFLREHRIEILYASESDRNLATLRNLSVKSSRGEYVAFIDDDECPADRWLAQHLAAVRLYEASGSLGPILPSYAAPPPEWIVKGRLCERLRMKTGSSLSWGQTRTGNALLKRDIFLDPGNAFNPKYRLGGEDDDLFRRLMRKGHRFVWCDEATVQETIPAERLTLSYFVKRSRLVGFMSYRYDREERSGPGNIAFVLRSTALLVVSTLLLPVCRIAGFRLFAQMLIRHHFHKAVVLTSIGRLRLEERAL